MEDRGRNNGTVRVPFIVVSDLHLGSEGSKDGDFWDFLDWLATLPVKGTVFKCNSTELTIKKPGTLVLLGDILEFWDPREDDRNYIIKDVVTPLSILNNLDCDIIYVIGNHDEDMLEVENVWEEKGVSFPYNGRGTIKIVHRTYPEKIRGRKVEGIEIGKHRYAFLHGHQFDPSQFCYKISVGLSRLMKRDVRWDPIDWFQDLANVSYSKNIRLKLNGRPTGDTLLFIALLILYGLVYYWRKDTPIGSAFGLLWVIISFFFVVTILPKVVTYWITKIWRQLPKTVVKKGTSVEEVVENGYYKPKKGQKIKADIIVFGHTHNAGCCMKEPKEPEKEKRLFINTGCWVSDCEEEKKNTFLYINTDAAYLLRWDKGKVVKGEIPWLGDSRSCPPCHGATGRGMEE